MSASSSAGASRGVLYTLGAFICWGLFPLYWKPLHAVPALQILCHRIVWSALFVAVVLTFLRQWGDLRAALRQPRQLAIFGLSSTVLSLNWLIYIWAVNAGHVVEGSLGYFINPLVNVLLGRVFLGERLSRPQSLAVALAALGVIWLTVSAGSLPWIALSLAATFGVYGLLRKKAPLASLPGLALETFLMSPLALAALLWFGWQGQGAFGQMGLGRDLLLMGAGVVTAVPLLMFAAGARRLKLATVGLIQYVGPSIQLALGVMLYDEPFGSDRALGFALIWTALLLYSAVGLRALWRERRMAGA
ncbi:EamA family transporter RarD [Chromobacterium subtsugae]|uniref:EamA family transporter RarD n=1 Tax=Chromobacterium subtsugae TaxID=251747 RepID=A0ABS7FJ16_9NEIS|nr:MULTISPECIES: EamA family transporter RarD [Chromobacterium]KUM02241.1 transporter [Chromobacterium subtsugae]KZE86196.1 transporter [Chromobacterium sp. F49]MBW7568043.1 EamA family transporter RarD [Chromobacterium subtsugae]MBW8290075.1 EamA family transporter RarD [Chromobacterium subtsugae]OBU86269.1 transporter [Chromobacterium subtsugae]